MTSLTIRGERERERERERELYITYMCTIFSHNTTHADAQQVPAALFMKVKLLLIVPNFHERLVRHDFQFPKIKSHTPR